MTCTKEELQEAKRQIDSTLHKLRETVRTLEGRRTPAGINPRSLWRTGASRPLALRFR
ncbi:MAG: hypothetical protein V8Q30_13870 [Acutalibacteraceae bacterium]